MIFENVSGVLQSFEMTLVDVISLTLEVGTEIPADLRTFVPFQSKPCQSLINGGGGFLGIA